MACDNTNYDGDALLRDYFANLAPSWTPDTTEETETRRLVVVPVTKLYGESLFGKLRGVRVDQGSPSWLQMVLISANTGGPLVINVGQYSETPQVLVRYREATGLKQTVYEPDDGDECELAEDGRSVILPIPDDVRDSPGVYRAQVRVTRASDGVEVARDETMLLVDRGMWLTTGDAPAADRGPPTVQEIRTAMRDHPGANRLLAAFDYDLAEIGNGIVSAVTTFNGGFPPLPVRYDTTNFPIGWRRNFLDGTLAYLFETMAAYQRRGHLPYSAGGLTIDDLAKEKEYIGAADYYRSRYVQFVKNARAQINIASAWGSVGSAFWNGTY